MNRTSIYSKDLHLWLEEIVKKMFLEFFFKLKNARIPVSLNEFFTFLESIKLDFIEYDVNKFYYLARTSLIKDERLIDRFDVIFGQYFKGIESIKLDDILDHLNVPKEWVQKMLDKHFSKQEMEDIKALGGFDELMKTLEQRLKEQEKRHQGGNKWIGTAGKSPFGAYGYNPEGIRIGQKEGKNKKAVKVWDKREFSNLDGDVELGTRNIKIALRRLRKFAREGAETELDLDNTIKSTAHKGYIDVKMMPERRNKIKVLLFFDVGGSMDAHVKICEELFSAARTEFKHMEYFYYHNCLYDAVWKDNNRRYNDNIKTWDVLHTYPSDYKVIFVGDAEMSPYEITYPGGSVEFWNEESGETWLTRMLNVYENAIWLNPIPERYWDRIASTSIIKQIFSDRMFPLTIEGIDQAMRELNK